MSTPWLRTLSSIVVLGGLTSTLGAQGTFEGTVNVHMTAGQPVDIVYSVKGDHIRADITGSKVTMYMIREGDKSDMVLPAQRMYMEQSISGALHQMQSRADSKPPKITRTGRMETIAGHECEHIILSGDDGDYDVCLAQGMGTFMGAGGPMGGGRGAGDPSSAVMAQLGGGFPLKMQKVGGETILEVTNIEKKPLPESMFSIPSDYRKMDMGAMMGRPPQH